MKKATLTTLALLLLCSSLALASGSSSSSGAAAITEDPLDVTETLRVTVAEILPRATSGRRS